MPATRSRVAQANAAQDSQSAPRPHGPRRFPIVGIGASAGGLDACIKLFAPLPADSGLTFILVQHLDPNHESMMADLLANHTSLTVRQAAHGMKIERNHLYIIPPGAYLSVGAGVLLLSEPQARHGARLPFDFLLHSLAHEFGARAACVVLSGMGADGSLGLESVKKKGGLVIAQEPTEASFGDMPKSAIMTGAVDLVLPAAKIADALLKYGGRNEPRRTDGTTAPQEGGHDYLAEIVALLHEKTGHDLHLYKRGTLNRRIERRMGMAALDPGGKDRYLEILRRDTNEIELLAKDLLIHVTNFFRDPAVFDVLANEIIPDLIRKHPADQPLRIWTAGCSTGEETYSLAILFREAINEANLNINLQIFASDVDPNAIATAREGIYPDTIEADVSPERLARFFSFENHTYKASSDLRASVIFTVQDVLTDPPFSRLDFISCRNLLIYLSPEAQAKVISLFHFSLRQGGVLLLGNSETVGANDGRFEVISKPERLYRRIGRHRPGDIGSFANSGAGAYVPARRTQDAQAPSRQAALADLCRKLVIDAYAPATVLVNRRYECLYFLGPTDRYLRVPPGAATHDLLAMVNPSLRIKLRAAIQRVDQEQSRIVVAGSRTSFKGELVRFHIEIRSAVSEDDELLLISFIDEPHEPPRPRRVAPGDATRVAELEQELEDTRTELQDAILSLEKSSEEQKAINEEALSANEEYQSTNEELVTSKEELQSLNEELTALNNQLQETLEQQRTTSDDLQNVLYSTDVATLFLDNNLRIRFFTPATKSLFNVIPGDVGRPLADLHSLAADSDLLQDAREVLETFSPREREVEAQRGVWFSRRILPYRAHDKRVEGVVITFTDITERRQTADALNKAKREAELADAAKSRFLAAASHDLRQPLQSLALLQGMLAKTVNSETAKQLVARQEQTLGAALHMLNTLLDINQIEKGVIRPELATFSLNDLFERLKEEFAYHAQAQALTFRVVPCALFIRSDARLLEQMLRNIISNAFKHTAHGKILLGCRRRAGKLSIEVWDTGVGIADEHLQSIFEEYVQVDNPARERERGVGLGLSIVQRLGRLLDHRVSVRSRLGKGSVFAIDVIRGEETTPRHEAQQHEQSALSAEAAPHGAILVVEDDSEVRELLELLLKAEGHRVVLSRDGTAALEYLERTPIRPDLILADYNLPNGMNGLQLIANVREKFHHAIPVIILTGDISADALRRVALEQCVHLTKPVTAKELTQAVNHLLPRARATTHTRDRSSADAPVLQAAVVAVIDDESLVRDGIRSVLEDDGHAVAEYGDAESFLESRPREREACLLIDAYLPGMNGLELLRRLRARGDRRPAIIITGRSDITVAVEAMKAGASDFLEKPVGRGELLASIARALEQGQDAGKLASGREAAAKAISGLTTRERQIMDRVLAGDPSKNIAADLGISQRTVENHRASIMKKTGAASLPALARLAVAATTGPNMPLD